MSSSQREESSWLAIGSETVLRMKLISVKRSRAVDLVGRCVGMGMTRWVGGEVVQAGGLLGEKDIEGGAGEMLVGIARLQMMLGVRDRYFDTLNG